MQLSERGKAFQEGEDDIGRAAFIRPGRAGEAKLTSREQVQGRKSDKRTLSACATPSRRRFPL